MAKNECGKTRPENDPYEIWVGMNRAPGWVWRVLKKYQSPENEAKNPYARWFCSVSSPLIEGTELGDVYVREITDNAQQTWKRR
jgi:hypothetical protein